MTWLMILGGLGLLTVGAELLVRGAVGLAEAVRMAPLVIGLTVVAYGTSAPELAVSVSGSMHGDGGVALGNIVGSNIFNLSAVFGGSAAVAGEGIPVAEAARSFDLPVMVAVAACCCPILLTGGRIDRWEGALFFGYYVAYVVYLALHAFDHQGADEYRFAMVYVVLPLAGLAIIGSVIGWVFCERGGNL